MVSTVLNLQPLCFALRLQRTALNNNTLTCTKPQILLPAVMQQMRMTKSEQNILLYIGNTANWFRCLKDLKKVSRHVLFVTTIIDDVASFSNCPLRKYLLLVRNPKRKNSSKNVYHRNDDFMHVFEYRG